MPPRLRHWLAAMFSMALVAHAGAVRIEGLSPVQPVSARGAVKVEGGVLRIELPDAHALSVSPWPEYLPQRFGKQEVAASRLPHPAGPIDRLELRRISDSRPWLIVSVGARASQEVIGGWILDFADGGWILRKGRAQRVLGGGAQKARMARLTLQGDVWCVYLLGAQESVEQDSALAHEHEAQASWAAVRSKAGKCRTRP